jgi:hypothetical protein
MLLLPKSLLELLNDYAKTIIPVTAKDNCKSSIEVLHNEDNGFS